MSRGWETCTLVLQYVELAWRLRDNVWGMGPLTSTYRAGTRSNAMDISGVLRKMAVQVMAAVSIALLFLPYIGPQLDHHFAERRPDHTHVFLGSEIPEHIHFFEGRHRHYHPGPSPETNLDNVPYDVTPEQRIIYLTSDEGLGQGAADPAPRGVQSSPGFPGQFDNPFAFGLDRNTSIPSPALTPPPWRPPTV